jgi:hypothetical protein
MGPALAAEFRKAGLKPAPYTSSLTLASGATIQPKEKMLLTLKGGSKSHQFEAVILDSNPKLEGLFLGGPDVDNMFDSVDLKNRKLIDSEGDWVSVQWARK